MHLEINRIERINKLNLSDAKMIKKENHMCVSRPNSYQFLLMYQIVIVSNSIKTK